MNRDFEDYKTTRDRLDDLDTNADIKVVFGIIVALAVTVALILWTPDVEAIGTWVYGITN